MNFDTTPCLICTMVVSGPHVRYGSGDRTIPTWICPIQTYFRTNFLTLDTSYNDISHPNLFNPDTFHQLFSHPNFLIHTHLHRDISRLNFFYPDSFNPGHFHSDISHPDISNPDTYHPDTSQPYTNHPGHLIPIGHFLSMHFSPVYIPPWTGSIQNFIPLSYFVPDISHQNYLYPDISHTVDI